MRYLDTKIDYYEANVYKPNPIGECTLGDMLNAIKNPNQKMLSLFKQIEEASTKGDKALKSKLKTQTYYFTPNVRFNSGSRRYENISSFLGTAILDFDNLSPETAIELKKYLFDTYPFIIASYLSVSKRGLKCLVRIPVVNSVDEFKALFYGLAIKFQYIKGFDGSAQSPVLPCYLTYDEDILIREDAIEWAETGYKEQEFKIIERVEAVELEDVTEEDREQIISIVQNMVDKAVDSGHSYIRSASLVMWGYSSYFDEATIQDTLFDMIDGNAYLSQKASTYKRTVLDMKNLGASAPLYLPRHEQ